MWLTLRNVLYLYTIWYDVRALSLVGTVAVDEDAEEQHKYQDARKTTNSQLSDESFRIDLMSSQLGKHSFTSVVN